MTAKVELQSIRVLPATFRFSVEAVITVGAVERLVLCALLTVVRQSA